MLKINLDEIGGGLSLNENVPVTALPELKAMQTEGELAFSGPLAFSLHLERLGNVIAIEGALRGEATMNCGRCLNDYPQALESNFTLKAVPATDAPPRHEKETELLSEDIDAVTYAGNTLDLREILQEQVILALPLAPVCRANCRGLCSNCGHDLNHSLCGCDTKPGHPAFAGLKDLLQES